MNPQTFVDLVEKETGIKMMNTDKVTRAISGTATSTGLVGGVGEDASSDVILAKYDLIGGFMTKGGYKVKNETFFDKKTKQPVKGKKIVLLIRVNGEYVEQEEDAPESLEIKIAKKQHEAKKVKKSDKE